MNHRSHTATNSLEIITRLSVRSALHPMLWLCGIVTVPSFVAFGYVHQPPDWWIALAFLPVIAAVAGFLFLLIFDRARLQSEEYQIRTRSLDLNQATRGRGARPIQVRELQSVATLPLEEEEGGRARPGARTARPGAGGSSASPNVSDLLADEKGEGAP